MTLLEPPALEPLLLFCRKRTGVFTFAISRRDGPLTATCLMLHTLAQNCCFELNEVPVVMPQLPAVAVFLARCVTTQKSHSAIIQNKFCVHAIIVARDVGDLIFRTMRSLSP
jgi:hypothetical protein